MRDNEDEEGDDGQRGQDDALREAHHDLAGEEARQRARREEGQAAGNKSPP